MELEANWSRAFRVWWAFVWRTALLLAPVFLLSGLLAHILGFLFEKLGLLPSTALGLGRAFTIVAMFALSILPIRWILGKKLKDFRLVMLSLEMLAQADQTIGEVGEKEITWGNVLRVWWAFTWRSAVAAFLISFVIFFVASAVGASSQTLRVMEFINNNFLWLPIALLIWKRILNKKFKTYRLALITTEPSKAS